LRDAALIDFSVRHLCTSTAAHFAKRQRSSAIWSGVRMTTSVGLRHSAVGLLAEAIKRTLRRIHRKDFRSQVRSIESTQNPMTNSSEGFSKPKPERA
jgi:hypothetical protein